MLCILNNDFGHGNVLAIAMQCFAMFYNVLQSFAMRCIWDNNLENCTCSCCAMLCNLQDYANVLKYGAKCDMHCCAMFCNVLQWCASGTMTWGNVLALAVQCSAIYNIMQMFCNMVQSAICNVVHLGQGLGAMCFPLMFISSNFSHSLQARSLKQNKHFIIVLRSSTSSLWNGFA